MVPATTAVAERPALWKTLFDEVWAVLRANGVTSALPAGRVAVTVHRGAYAGLGDPLAE